MICKKKNAAYQIIKIWIQCKNDDKEKRERELNNYLI